MRHLSSFPGLHRLSAILPEGWSSAIGHKLERRPWHPDILALAFLLACVLYLFKDAIWSGLVYYEADTLNFYYPILVMVQESLKEGAFPLLWTPNIFAGFPLFADGEAGMLYPFNLLMLALFPAAQAYIGLMVIRFFLAVLFMYAFARTLKAGCLGATVAAMVFAFGSFLVAQIHHTNLANGAIWLPLVLLFVEKALRTSGAKQNAYLLLGGVALAVQALAVHVQPLIMTLLAVAFYACFRVIAGPVAGEGKETREERRGWRKALKGKVILLTRLLIVPAVGLSLAAVQLLPLYELARFSFRSTGADYRFASEYSSTVFNLISLIFPYFFRSADGSSWSIWGAWEPTIYIGIAPLVLAGIGILFLRNRYTLLFLILAVVGLAISLGPHSPLPLHWLLWHVPGFSSLRSPGRFNFLFLFAAAMLAAFGTRWIMQWVSCRKEGTADSQHNSFWLRGSYRASRLLAAYLAALATFLVSLVWTIHVDNQWLVANKSQALSLINRWYLRFFDNPLNITPERVYNGLLHSVSLTNPQTATSLVILACTLLLLCFGFRRSKLLGGSLLILLIAVDLLPYGQAFHPSMPVESLSRRTDAISFLQERSGLQRAFARSIVPSLQPNRPLPFGIPAFGGYSSLHPDRNWEYELWLKRGNNILPDLAGIRYLIEPTKPAPTPSHRRVYQVNQVYVDPEFTLARGSSQNRNSQASFLVQPTAATSARVIATLYRAEGIPQGAVVAEMVAYGEGAERQTLLLKAGEHLSESAYDRPDVQPNVKHSKAPVAITLPDTDHLSRPQKTHLYYADLPFTRPMKVSRLDFRYVYPKGRVGLYGLSLFNKDTAQSTSVRSNAKYQQAYENSEAIIYENITTMPRAFFVTSYRIMPPESRTLGEMAHGDIDVRKTAVLEEKAPELKDVSGNLEAAPYRAEIVLYSPQRVVVEVECSADGLLILTDAYYPGWVALVDGQPQRIYRADYLFRGVPLESGRHLVEFLYDPFSLKLGAAITLVALVLVLAYGYHLWRRGWNAA